MPQDKDVSSVQFTADQFISLAKELRKPSDPTDDEKAKKASELENRRALAQLEKDKQEARRIEQEMCPHTRFEDGSSRMVYVANGNYLICQYCQFILRPEEDVKNFNHHFGRQMQRTTY